MRDNRVRRNYYPQSVWRGGGPHRSASREDRDYEKWWVRSRSLEVANQFNREGSFQLLCRLAPREEHLERLLRIFKPHLLLEHLVLKFHCLVQLFA